MRSDDTRLRLALDAMARPIAEFRAALQGALRQAESALAGTTADAGSRAERARAELGAFAAGRVRPEAFAAIAPAAALDQPAAAEALRSAATVLHSVLDMGESLFQVDVPPGWSLAQTVGEALARIGRAFGAVMLAELARGGRYRAEEHDRLLDPLAYRHWNRAERRFAPPLVITIDGADLHAGALADYCDGRAKLVLVVRGPCAPAALARLITPGVLVLQTVDGAGLDRMVACEGPCVAALVPEGAACFLHDPAGGSEPWQRLRVAPLPEPPKHALGGLSAWQMQEDLRQLATLAQTPFTIPAGGPAGSGPALGSSDAVDRLSSWLLQNADLPDH